MKDLVWDRVLSVEVDEIDEDHRKLIGIFNTLNHAVSEGESQEYLAAVLRELINCTVWHFSHEERLMLKYGYPEKGEHETAHRELIDSARDLQDKILQSDRAVAEDDILFLERWLTEHIFTDDMRLGSYLAEVM
jgi:hemerythrin-like metal-binding protein